MIPDDARRRYLMQRRRCAKLGVEFRLTPLEWWRLWQQSRRWAERGRGLGGWVMARRDRSQGFTVENAVIVPATEASSAGKHGQVLSYARRQALKAGRAMR